MQMRHFRWKRLPEGQQGPRVSLLRYPHPVAPVGELAKLWIEVDTQLIDLTDSRHGSQQDFSLLLWLQWFSIDILRWSQAHSIGNGRWNVGIYINIRNPENRKSTSSKLGKRDAEWFRQKKSPGKSFWPKFLGFRLPWISHQISCRQEGSPPASYPLVIQHGWRIPIFASVQKLQVAILCLVCPRFSGVFPLSTPNLR